MTDKSIQEHLLWLERLHTHGNFEKYGKDEEKVLLALSFAVDLATRYLSVGCPEKKEIGEMRYGGCNPDEDRGYNEALDDYRLWLTKKLDGLGKIVKEKLRTTPIAGDIDRTHAIYANEKLIEELAQAIREHLTN